MDDHLFSHSNHKRIRILAFVIFLFAVISIVLLQWIMSKNFSKRDYPEIVTDGVLRVAVESNPLSYFLNQNDTIGLEYEMWKLLAAESGLRVEFVPVLNLYKAQEALRMQKVDVVGVLMPVSANHPEWFAFLSPILGQRYMLIQKKENVLKNPIFLAGQTLHLMAGNMIIHRLRNLSSEIGDTIRFSHVRNSSIENLIDQVDRGKIKYAVVGEHLANYFSLQYPDIDVTTPLSFTQFQAWQVRSSSSVLRDSINEWLNRISVTIDYQDVIDKYYPNSVLQ